MVRTKLFILTLIFLLFGVQPVFAEFTFTVPNTTITSEEEIEPTITLSLQSQGNKIYYLEGAFKKEGSPNYFGLTWNDSSWIQYTSSNFTALKSITTDSDGKWSGVVKVKIDKDNSLFSGSGTYTLRMKRFTTGGTGSWADNSIDITVNATSPIPTETPSSITPPSPSPTSSPTPTNIPSPKPKTTSTTPKTPAPTTNPTTLPTIQQSKTPTPLPAKSKPKATPQTASVAAVTASVNPSAQVSVKSQKKINYFTLTGIILIFAGIGSIGYIYLKSNAKIPNPFR